MLSYLSDFCVHDSVMHSEIYLKRDLKMLGYRKLILLLDTELLPNSQPICIYGRANNFAILLAHQRECINMDSDQNMYVAAATVSLKMTQSMV